MPATLSVEDSFAVSGRGIMLVGTVTSGTLRLGERIFVVDTDGSRQDARIQRIALVGNVEVDVAREGDSVGLELAGLRRRVAPGATVEGDEPSPAVQTLERLALGGPDSADPLLLLPLRLETAFDGTTLRIRAFPDQVHVDVFDPDLDSIERELLESLLAARDAGGDAARAASDELVRALGAPRARWLERLARGGATSAPPFDAAGRPVARCLPPRLVAHAIAGDRRFGAVGREIPDTLALGPGERDTVLAHPADGPLRWLVDFDAAEALGMALTLPLDAAAASDGIDRLIVFGADTERDAGERFEALLDAHALSVGLAHRPTFAPVKGARAAPRWPDTGERSTRRLQRALGLSNPLPLEPRAHADPNGLGRRLAIVLWQGAIEPNLRELHGVRDPATLAEARALVIDALAPLGAFPTLQVGREPYAIAPVAASRDASASAGPLGRLEDAIDATLEPLARAVADARAETRSGGRAETIAHALLRHPVGQHWRLRRQMPLEALIGTLGAARGSDGAKRFAARLADHLSRAARSLSPFRRSGEPPIVPAAVGLPATPSVCHALVRDTLDGDALDDGPLADPGLRALLGGEKGREASAFWHRRVERLRRSGTPDWDPRGTTDSPSQEKEPDDRPDDEPDAEPLLRLYAENAVLRALSDLAVASRAAPDALLERAAKAFGSPGADERGWYLRHELAVALFEAIGKEVPLKEIGESVAAGFSATTEDARVALEGAARALGDVVEALEGIDAASARATHVAFAALLDCLSHRPDAWLSAFALRRLERVRKDAGAALGVGAWSIVEDVRPASGTARAAEWLAAPSERLARLATLVERARGGFVEAELDGVLDMDLSAPRIAAARELLGALADSDGVDVALCRVISERLAAAGRADLIERLARRFPCEGRGVGTWFDGEVVLGGAAHKFSDFDRDDTAAIDAVRERVDVALDAVADLHFAEAAGLLAEGRPEAAGGALAGLSAGAAPPAGFAADAPSSDAASLAFSVALASTLSGGTVGRDDLSALSPRLARLASEALGPMRGTVELPGGSRTLASLGLTPIALAALAGPGLDPEERLARWTRAALALPADAPVVPDADARSTLWAAGRLGALLREARALVPEDVPDAALERESEALELDLESARAALERLMAERPRTPPSIAVPSSGTGDDIGTGIANASTDGTNDPRPTAGNDGIALGGGSLEPAAPVADPATLSRYAARLFALGLLATPDPALIDTGIEAIAERLDASASSTDEAGALQTLLGELAAPLPLSAPDVTAWRAAPALGGAGPARLSHWLELSARVRERLAPIADLLLGRPDPALLALQWPARDVSAAAPLDWIGGELHEDDVYFARAGLLTLGMGAELSPREVFAGLLVDAWQESVPARTVAPTLGIRADAPPARAPQAWLLAAPPDDGSPWNPAALAATLERVADTARVRALVPADLPAADPASPSAADGIAAILPLDAVRDTETTLTRAACSPRREG